MANFFDLINPLKAIMQFSADNSPAKTKDVTLVDTKPVSKKKTKSKTPITKSAPLELRKPEQLVMGSKIASEFPIPLRQPRKSGVDFERKVVGYTYRIVASKKYGYPSGQDPLLLLFIEDRARLTKTPKVSIDSIREMVSGAGVDAGGSQYERTRLAIKRYFNSKFSVFKGSSDGVAITIEWFKAIHLKGITAADEWKEEDGNYVCLSCKIA